VDVEVDRIDAARERACAPGAHAALSIYLSMAADASGPNTAAFE
jgi:hypothetical protein